MSFEQWYHEVQCVKDHYPEAVVQESIVQSLKGPVVDIARYMGPTSSVAHILQNLFIIFGEVASFDVLKQNIYKVTKGNNEKVPSFVMWLEGTLNQTQLQCPRRMMDLEVQQHLNGHLSHGVCKHICNSVWYLYSTPSTSYSQMMAVTRKAMMK